MKKIVIALLAALAVAPAAMAQPGPRHDRDGRPDENPYLPKKGDFALGIDLIPIVKTIGESFSDGDKYSAEGVGGSPFIYDTEDMYIKPNVSIMGKYMITDKWAAKVNVGLRLKNQTSRYYVEDQLGTFLEPNSDAKVTDTRRLTESGCTFMLGAEYRLGKRRVQGIFGFGVLVGFSTKKATYSYGNKLTDFNQNPLTSPELSYPGPQPAGYRVTAVNYQGPSCALGGYGSVGIEWFVGKKIALGASVDLYAYGSFSSKAYVKSEGFNQAYQKVENRTDLVSPGNSGAGFGTDNLGGALYTIFYF
ncbi:MAG: hypothetical protein J1E97_05720 [Muribaculaceae bacterium]|nr:hypothetical protein [Muribaculaceae bacterium]